VTLQPKDVDRALRARLWPALKAHGFAERTERVAWRYAGDDIDVVEVQAVGQRAEAVGCTPLSLSVIVASNPRFLAPVAGIPAREGRLRPHYWHCDPFRRSIEKTLAQPWFRPFSEPRDNRKLPSSRLHREALKGLVRREVHDRPEIWYMRDDSSNLDENVGDMTTVVLTSGLDLLDSFHDPARVRELIESGWLVNATSPRARELLAAIDEYAATDRRADP
jgi:hypothetical protein